MKKMKILPAAYVLAPNPIRSTGINLGLIWFAIVSGGTFILNFDNMVNWWAEAKCKINETSGLYQANYHSLV